VALCPLDRAYPQNLGDLLPPASASAEKALNIMLKPQLSLKSKGSPARSADLRGMRARPRTFTSPLAEERLWVPYCFDHHCCVSAGLFGSLPVARRSGVISSVSGAVIMVCCASVRFYCPALLAGLLPWPSA